MTSASPSPVARSSLEEMLHCLLRKDESNSPTDLPPALPARPTSKARRPKRPLPARFDIGDVVSPEADDGKRQFVKGNKTGSDNFGRKTVSEMAACGESPYSTADVHEYRLAENGGADLATPSPSPEEKSDDRFVYFIKKKLKVWCPLRNGHWELGNIQSIIADKASISLLNGTVMFVPTQELLAANTEVLDGVDNLIQLSYLNEPSVLHNLQYRYDREVIYTMAGPVLLAINPFKELSIYGNDIITAYQEKILDNPHVYAMADAAYNDMMRDCVNQSIIISGESGAGKTETAKLAIEYLVVSQGEDCETACKIRETACILEAFGNAKTSQNNNSSRFGKLIDVRYNAKGIVCGAYIHTLLLEKSRVSQFFRGERSYHVFYQICAGAPSDMKDRLNLKTASEYKFLNRSGCLQIHDVDDAQNFKKLMEAFDTLQISHEDQEHIFKLLAAILWLGNITFDVIHGQSDAEVVIDEASRTAARLMGCKVKDLVAALSTHREQSGTDDIAQKSTLQQAIDSRDAVARFVYASLFSWLVEAINRSLEGDMEHSGRSISVLDTYGFESFQKNSFEQFLINYADERLQQHFIRHLFKLEQEEYESEGIDWKKVEFEDNQECLDLFEKKTEGLISILDEASNSAEATDLTFANNIKEHLSSNSHFKGERGSFSVHHYAGEVQYETTGFLDKNRDELQHDTILFLLSRCKQLRTSELVESDLDNRSVGTKFKGQLFKFIQQLENSKPHFIRCIRPNHKQLRITYDNDTVLQQLRSGSVPRTLKISKCRYPTRLTHQDFATRFGCLLSKNIICKDPLSTSVAILQQYHVPQEMYQVGYTKLFFRAKQVDVLEKVRQEVIRGTYKVEKGFLGGQVLRDFHELKSGIITLQAFIRGENSRREYDALKKSSHELAPQSLDEHLKEIIHIQSVTRGWLARKYFNHLRNWKTSSVGNPKTRRKSHSKISEAKVTSQENLQILPSNVEELQKLVVKAELSLSQREHENTSLREQVRQFDARWLEHETKTKAVEDTFKRQIGSLQRSLAAAKKALGAGNLEDFDDISGTQNHSGNTLIELMNNGVSNTVDHLSKEFDQMKNNFDNDVKSIIEAKSVNTPCVNQIEEYRKVKQRFEAWKKEYKNRLRETKTKLLKDGVNGENGGDKRARHWWEKLSKRY